MVLIIMGPTASGKTELSELIAGHLDSEIINVDMGQFYAPLSIGTAKPNWQNSSVKSHFFDIINKPQELGVAEYRARILVLIDDILARKKTPIIVGGSLFYIKSLFYPPLAYPAHNGSLLTGARPEIDLTQDNNSLWETLKSIDPVRAQALHPNDRYRVERALKIWEESGIKPSECQPIFSPVFNALIVNIEPPRDVMFDRINRRTEAMIKQNGWIEEAKGLVGTEWESFLITKGLIGYKELFDWVRTGENLDELDKVIEIIATQTRQYAKRQIVFWNKLAQEFEQACKKSNYVIKIKKISHISDKNALEIIQLL